MKITTEVYNNYMSNFEEITAKELTPLIGEFVTEHASEHEILFTVLQGSIVNPNMLKGFIIAWKICSLQTQANEVEQLNRMVGL